jgi:hypothetical protein
LPEDMYRCGCRGSKAWSIQAPSHRHTPTWPLLLVMQQWCGRMSSPLRWMWHAAASLPIIVTPSRM